MIRMMVIMVIVIVIIIGVIIELELVFVEWFDLDELLLLLLGIMVLSWVIIIMKIKIWELLLENRE